MQVIVVCVCVFVCWVASAAVVLWVAVSDYLTAPVTRMQENICFTENKSSLNEGLEIKSIRFSTE